MMEILQSSHPFGFNVFVTKDGFGCSSEHECSEGEHECIPKFAAVPVPFGDRLVKILTGKGSIFIHTRNGVDIQMHTRDIRPTRDYQFIRLVRLEDGDEIIEAGYVGRKSMDGNE